MPLKWTSSSHFIPARNSRHRTACFALYRALLRLAPTIPLPPDLATGFGTKINPITHLIRRSFKRNRSDTSPRLVNPALKAGYRFLTLLSRASDPASSERSQVVSYLGSRLAARTHQIETKAPPHSRNPPKPTSAPNPQAPPLLVKTSPDPTPENPHPKPQYATPNRPVPLSQLRSGARRQVPRLDMASDFPFLRLKKPQSNVLSRVLTQKIRKRVARQENLTRFYEELLPDAKEEDQWERLVHDLLEREALPERVEARPQDRERVQEEMRAFAADTRFKDTYERTMMKHGVAWLNQVLRREREDQVARADAMYTLIKEEAALAAKEKEEGDKARRMKWEERMLAEHGEGWERIIEEEKRVRDEARAKRMIAADATRAAKESASQRKEAAVEGKKQDIGGDRRVKRGERTLASHNQDRQEIVTASKGVIGRGAPGAGGRNSR